MPSFLPFHHSAELLPLEYNPEDFECVRVNVPNGDVAVPMTLVYHKSVDLKSTKCANRNETCINRRLTSTIPGIQPLCWVMVHTEAL